MYLKRYLVTLTAYYLPYALLVHWVDSLGAQPNEAHATAQVIMALLYTGMSLNLVVFRPQVRFAFASWMRRVMRWVMYQLEYIGLVLLPALLLLHADSSAFGVTLPIPALLFLGILHSSGKKRDQVKHDVTEKPYPQSPLARGLHYALAYFVIFTGLAVLLKGPFDEAGVPNHFRPVLFSMMLFLPYVLMAMMLTVMQPAEHFDFQGRGRRWSRFFIYVGLFVLLCILLPFFPANLGSNHSWLAGLAPLFLFAFMVQPAKPRIRLPSIPGTTDSRWRGLRYAGVFTLLQLVVGGGLVGVWFSLGKDTLGPGFMDMAAITLSPFIALLVMAMLHRLIVSKPHSRFEDMPRKLRYGRWWRYVFTYFMVQVIGPYAMLEYWHWNPDFNYSIALIVVLFQAAAYGTDATPVRSAPPEPPRETREEAIQRRLDTLSRAVTVHPR